MFVPTTPGSKLKKALQEEVNKTTIKVKVVEKSGTSLTSLLQRSNPARERNCQRENCLLCTSNGKGDCTKNEIVYEIECEGCGDRYIGETSRNAYTRGEEHKKALVKREQRSVLWNHCKEKHDEVVQNFTMSVRKSFHQDAILRQIMESTLIRSIYTKGNG